MLLVLFLTACGDSNTDLAKEFNDKLVNTHQQAEYKMARAFTKISNLVGTGKTEELAAAGKDAIALLDLYERKLDSITVPKIPMAKELKQTHLNLLEYNKRGVEICMEMVDLKSDEDFDKLSKRYEQVVQSAKQAEFDMSAFRAKYAEFYGAKVRDDGR
jgi:uncharacterized protein YlaN (UPF0358 family)